MKPLFVTVLTACLAGIGHAQLQPPSPPTFLGGGGLNLSYGALGKSLVVVSAQYGSDTSGRRERPDRPFKTIEAARAAAQAGDTIVILPGVYVVTNNLVKDGVSWYAYRGATVQMAYGGPSLFGGYVNGYQILGEGIWSGTIVLSNITSDAGITLEGLKFDTVTVGHFDGYYRIKANAVDRIVFVIGSNNTISTFDLDIGYVTEESSAGLTIVAPNNSKPIIRFNRCTMFADALPGEMSFWGKCVAIGQTNVVGYRMNGYYR